MKVGVGVSEKMGKSRRRGRGRGIEMGKEERKKRLIGENWALPLFCIQGRSGAGKGFATCSMSAIQTFFPLGTEGEHGLLFYPPFAKGKRDGTAKGLLLS